MKNGGLPSNLAQHSSLLITLSIGYIWILVFNLDKKITSYAIIFIYDMTFMIEKANLFNKNPY